MSSVKIRKIPFVFVISLVLVVTVCVYSYVEQNVGTASIVLFLTGALLLLFCLIHKIKSKSKHGNLGVYQWRRTSFLSVITLLSIICLVGVNYASLKSPYRWDVTRYDQHTLSQATVDFIKGIEKPIELVVFYVGLPPQYLEDLLKEYERVSDGKITVKVTDPIEDISYAAKFGNVISGKERKLIAVAGGERKDVDFSDSPLSEEQVTNALVRVARETRKVYFLTGHGEYSTTSEDNEGMSQFADLLNANNMSASDLMLGITNKIPDDCDVLIVAGPRSNLSNGEIALIQRYLERGGDALFLIENTVITSPDVALTAEQRDKNPSLNGLLNGWGIHVGSDIVVDLASHVGGDVGSPATRNYIDHEAITRGLDYTFYVRPRSISVLENRRSTIKLAPIALTATKEKSWAETNRNLNVNYDVGVDFPGPVPISYLAWEEKENGDESDTRLITFTDADFLSNAYLSQYSNSAMGINVVNWLSELDYTVLADNRIAEVERLDLTSKQKRLIAALLFLMPLFAGLAGILVWFRR